MATHNIEQMTDLLDKAGALSAPEQLELAERCRRAEELLQTFCRCGLATRLVGDGCQYCNPELAMELEKEA